MFELSESKEFKHLLKIEEHEPNKVLNMCQALYRQEKAITCSRDPIIKLYDLSDADETNEDDEIRLLAWFKGHEMSVTAAST